jgi:hypothetical protein
MAVSAARAGKHEPLNGAQPASGRWGGRARARGHAPGDRPPRRGSGREGAGAGTTARDTRAGSNSHRPRMSRARPVGQRDQPPRVRRKAGRGGERRSTTPCSGPGASCSARSRLDQLRPANRADAGSRPRCVGRRWSASASAPRHRPTGRDRVGEHQLVGMRLALDDAGYPPAVRGVGLRAASRLDQNLVPLTCLSVLLALLDRRGRGCRGDAPPACSVQAQPARSSHDRQRARGSGRARLSPLTRRPTRSRRRPRSRRRGR